MLFEFEVVKLTKINTTAELSLATVDMDNFIAWNGEFLTNQRKRLSEIFF